MGPAAPVVAHGSAHLYRTVIRAGAKAGPNFADHFTIITIGCGAGTACVAIADAQTGRVYFPPTLKSAEALIRDTGPHEPETFNYRRNSRLLIVVGSPNEDLKNEGMTYYLWRSGRLTRLRFVTAAKLCGQP